MIYSRNEMIALRRHPATGWPSRATRIVDYIHDKIYYLLKGIKKLQKNKYFKVRS